MCWDCAEHVSPRGRTGSGPLNSSTPAAMMKIHHFDSGMSLLFRSCRKHKCASAPHFRNISLRLRIRRSYSLEVQRQGLKKILKRGY